MGAITSKQGTLIVQKPERKKSFLRRLSRGSSKGGRDSIDSQQQKQEKCEDKKEEIVSEDVDKENEEELNKIEKNLEFIKISISDAKKDLDKLNRLSKNIEDLIKELHKIEIKDDEETEKRKTSLEKDFFHTFQRIIKIKKLVTVEQKNNPDPYLKHLEEIKETILNSQNINENNFRDVLAEMRNKLNSVDEITDEIITKKIKISDDLEKLETRYFETEMRQKLEKHENTFKQFLENLKSLQSEIGDILDVSEEISSRKLSLFEQIDNILAVSVPETVKLLEIEEKIEILKPKILAFVGLESSDEYFEFVEALSANNSALEELNLDSDVATEKKKALLEEIGTLQEDLEKTASVLKAIEIMGEVIPQSSKEMLARIEEDLLRLETSEKLTSLKEEYLKIIEKFKNKLEYVETEL